MERAIKFLVSTFLKMYLKEKRSKEYYQKELKKLQSLYFDEKTYNNSKLNFLQKKLKDKELELEKLKTGFSSEIQIVKYI